MPSVTGKISRREPMTADHFEMLKGMTKGLPKANLPTPSVTHFFRGKAGIDPKVYPDLDQFFGDVARAYREEVADLARRGCTYLQMDEVPLAVICDPNNKEIVRARGEDPDKVIDAYIDVINAAICDRPPEMAVALHMCRGNQGHGMADGGYAAIADRLFSRLDVDGYFLEYKTPATPKVTMSPLGNSTSGEASAPPSASSAPRLPRSRAPMLSSAGSRRPPAWSTWTSSAFVRNADFPAMSAAASSRWTLPSVSLPAWSRWPTRSGARGSETFWVRRRLP